MSVDSFRSIDVCLKDLALDCDERLVVRQVCVYVRVHICSSMGPKIDECLKDLALDCDERLVVK